MTHLTVEFQSLKRLSDMFIRAHRANMEVQETSWPPNTNVWKCVGVMMAFSSSLQKLRGELLRSAALH